MRNLRVEDGRQIFAEISEIWPSCLTVVYTRVTLTALQEEHGEDMLSPERNTVDLTEILEPYLNRWVALSADQTRVVGSGNTPASAIEDAIRKGESSPIVMFAPAISGPHVL